MTTKRIYEVLVKNGVRVRSEFAELSRLGYDSDEAQEFSDELVGDISRIVEHGVNNGFGGSMKDALDMLIDMALTLGKPKITAKIDKLRTKKNDELQRMKLTKSDDVDVRAPILEYIRNSLDVLDVIEERADGNERVQRFVDRSRAEFEALRDALGEVINVSAVPAADYAKFIATCISNWRFKTVVSEYIPSVADYISRAKNAAERWGKIAISGPHAKKDQLPAVARDYAHSIAESRTSYDELDSLRAELARAQGYAEEIRAKTQESRAKLAEISALIEETGKEWKSGKLDGITAAARVKSLKADEERLQRDIRDGEARVKMEDRRLALAEEIVRTIAPYEDRPALLYEVCTRIDMTAAHQYLNGMGNLETGRNLLDKIKVVARAQQAQFEESVSLNRELDQEKDKLLEEQDRMLGELDGLTGAENKQSDEDYLASLFGEKQQTQAEEEVKSEQKLDLDNELSREEL